MNDTLILSILLLATFGYVVLQSRRIYKAERRLTNIENEAGGRLDMIDDQISDIGGSVIRMEALTDPGRNQGLRTFNHDYDGKPLSSYVAAIMPERFRRSGEMYVGPNKAPMPPASTRADFVFGPVVDLNKPIVPQPFADGEPYQSFDEEVAVDAARP